MNKIYAALFILTILFSTAAFGQVFPYVESLDSYAAPQPLNGNGGIRASSHVMITSGGLVGNCAEFQMASTHPGRDTLTSPAIGPLTSNTVASFYFRAVTYSGGVPVRYALTGNDKAEIYVGDTNFVFSFLQYTINSSNQNTGTGYIKVAVPGPAQVNGFPGKFKIIVYNTAGNNWLLQMDSLVVRDTLPIRPILTSVIINDSCRGDSTGSIQITATGATPPYHYRWNTGDTTAFIGHLAGGVYTVTVTDSFGVDTVRSETVGQPALQLLLDSLRSTDDVCNGAGQASAQIYPRGGTPGYNYQWSTNPIQNGQQAQNLHAGTYSVTVIDSKGCTVSATTQISEPPAIHITVSSTQTMGSNGTATAIATGGRGAFTYIWTPTGQTTATATGLTPGLYLVQVTDSAGCIATDTVRVDNISSVREATDNTLRVYPNPASNQLNLNVAGYDVSAMSVAIYDMTGRTVLVDEVAKERLNISSLREGVYMIRVTNTAKSYMRRFTIQR